MTLRVAYPHDRRSMEPRPLKARDRKVAGSDVGEDKKTTEANGRQAPKCNIQACENAYRSFDAASCTYRPPNGSRRFCRK